MIRAIKATASRRRTLETAQAVGNLDGGNMEPLEAIEGRYYKQPKAIHAGQSGCSPKRKPAPKERVRVSLRLTYGVRAKLA